MEIKEPEKLYEEADELTSQGTVDLEELLKNLNKESDSTKLRTEELYKEYLEEYNKKLQIGKLHIRVNKALKNIQSVDDLIIDNELDDKDLEKLANDIDIVNKYIKNNPEDEKYEMIMMILNQATAILEIEKILKENSLDESTKNSLTNLLDNIASKELRDKYEERINGIIDYTDEDELGAEELEEEMNMSNSSSKEDEEEIEPELLGDEEEVNTNNSQRRFFKLPNPFVRKIKDAWNGKFGLIAKAVEDLEELIDDKNVSVSELEEKYNYIMGLLNKIKNVKIKNNYEKRLNTINQKIEKRIKEEETKNEEKENNEEETKNEEQNKDENKAEKLKEQFNKIMDNLRNKPTNKNIKFAKNYIEKNKDNKDLFENEEVVNNYLQELDELYKENVLNGIKNKIEIMKNNPNYTNIIVAEKIVEKNKELLIKDNIYETYLETINNSILKYVSNEMNEIKQNPNIKRIEDIEKFIINRKANFENKNVLDACLSTLNELKKQIKEKEEADKKASNILETIKLTLNKAKENPTKENIDTVKNLINSYMYDKQIFSSSLEANKYLKEIEELSEKTFKQVTEGSQTKYSDLTKFIANKESQINKLRDKEQELRGKLIDLERQDFIHPELKLEKMAPIKREIDSIHKEIEYYTIQLNNSRKVLENRRHASVQEHYESLFNSDLASLSNEEIQKASSEKIDMDELKKYAQIKEKLNPIEIEPITKKDVSQLAADNFNASLSSAMSMRLTDIDQAERLIENAEKVFWANRSNYPQDRIDELQNNLEMAISTIKNQKYQNSNERTL